MATIQRFEDILAWQKGRELTKAIYSQSRKGEFSRDFALRDQIRKAAISITSNIAEGFERGGNKEFSQFLSNSKGSAGEVRSQLYVALDEAYISESEWQALNEQCIEISRMLDSFMNYLKGSDLKGRKFNQQ
ncbi:MAG: four helix bundle protein [Verrucomicrobiales bacterium]|nr:four helix bundle protein [Verrucomicrobiales bacterium]